MGIRFAGLMTFLLVLLALLPLTSAADNMAVPAPTAAELTASPEPKTGPMTIREAKIAMGWPRVLAMRPLGGMSDQRIAIIDLGFQGLSQWLDAHPQEKVHTVYVGDLSKESPNDPKHGYEVYRVARAVLGDAQLILYKISTPLEFLKAVDNAAHRGVVIINASLGMETPMIDETKDYKIGNKPMSFAEALDTILRKDQIFLFFASGNYRLRVHTWVSSEHGGDGMVVLHPDASSIEEAETLPVRLPQGSSKISLGWDFRNAPTANYQLELVSTDGQLLATAKANWKGMITLNYRSTQSIYARIRVRRLAGPSQGVLMRLLAMPGIFPGPGFDGVQTIAPYAYRESPFLIYIGGMGKTASGTLAPTNFSDIGRAPNGELLPHVLGPGQLMLDGNEIDGTSFASPFVTAIYATTFGYNFKNLMERTATKATLDPATQSFATSRWGVPAVMGKMFSPQGQLSITGPTKVEDVKHRIEGDSLVIDFRISRCCMQGMSWTVGVALIDVKARKWVMDTSGKAPIWGTKTLQSDQKDYVRTPIEVRIPLKALAAYKGRTLQMYFGIRVQTWERAGVSSDVASQIKVDEAPTVQVVP